MTRLSTEFILKSQAIKLVIFDVDGIFTDGRIYVDDKGVETKAFYVTDGLGIKTLHRMNIETAVISGRNAPSVALRMESLGIRHIFQGQENKLPVYHKLLKDLELREEETAYMGDDLPDLPVLRCAGLALTVPDAVKEVLEVADFVTQAKGGKGAVREVCELLLKAQGKWSEVLSLYL